MADYEINYEDERFKEVEAEKEKALTELEDTYGGMIEESENYYKEQIDASKEWAEKQSQIQQEQTDFAIDQIEQQKEQAKKDYTKEQSGAYVDWQKQSNQYGANAEKMASSGMTGTGFSESSQVSMYNTYQNRYAQAREAYGRAVLNYENAIKDARLQNNSALAEIAYKALQQQLELALQGFQYKNQLLIEQANKKAQIDSEYHDRYQDVLAQINAENALAEEIRQYNESMAFEREKFEYQKSKSSGGGGSGGSKNSGSSGGGTSIDKSKSSGGGSSNISKGGDTGKSVTAVNLDSALKAAGGPVSPATMNKLVKSGKVKETVKNGRITFQKAPVKDVMKKKPYSKFKF